MEPIDRSASPLRLGLMYLQAAPFTGVLERIRLGEEMGFDSLWIADHLTGQYPGIVSFEAWALLGALATVTTRARLGTMVTPIAFRHPALLAMSATTVDHASGGRLEIGLGIGGAPVDAASIGAPDWPGPERVARLEEQIDLLDRLFRGETVTGHHGYYPTDGAAIEPPVQRPRPPIIVAADGPRLIDLAARKADGWNTLGGQPLGRAHPPIPLADAIDATRRRVDQFEEARERAGRAPGAVRRTMLAYRLDPGIFLSPDAFAEYVGRYRETGMDEIIVYWPIDPNSFERVPACERGLERIAADVIPGLR